MPAEERPAVWGSRADKQEQAIWQRRFWEHRIRNETDFANHVQYIHYNPVKHGYVARPEDWSYSSIHRHHPHTIPTPTAPPRRLGYACNPTSPNATPNQTKPTPQRKNRPTPEGMKRFVCLPFTAQCWVARNPTYEATKLRD